jgi:hypothetical protein
MRLSFIILGFVFPLWACSTADDATDSNGEDTEIGDTDSDTDSDTDGDTDGEVKAACNSEERVGAFAVNLAEDYTNISGSVFTGVKPLGVPEVLAQDGRCTLLGPSSLFCESTCSASETCGFDETCIEAPLKQSAGTLTLTGMSIPVTVDPNGITFDYSLKIDDPYPAFSEGAKITLSAEGGEFEPFTLTGYGSSRITPVSTAITVDRDTPAIVEWVPNEGGDTQVQLNVIFNVHGATSGWIVCNVPDNGAFEIPAALVTNLIDLGLSGFPKIELVRRSIDTASIASGCVELSVYSLVKLAVEVEGLNSCNGQEDCEDGQICNDQLVCEDQ